MLYNVHITFAQLKMKKKYGNYLYTLEFFSKLTLYYIEFFLIIFHALF